MVVRCCFLALALMLVWTKVSKFSSPPERSLTSEPPSEIPEQIVKAMDGVPLAIEQARAMIRQGIPVRDFLGHFETQYQRTMAHKPPKSAWDYEKNMSIISVFDMLLTRLDKDGDAENILAFASCFGPRPIAVNLMGQVHQSENSAESSRSRWSEMQQMCEMAWLDHLQHDRLAFQLATGQLESLCLLKLKKNSEGNTVSVSLHGSISRWRFETLTSDMKEKWIIAGAWALSKSLPEVVDIGSQMKLLPLIRHFYTTIRRYVEPQKLESPDGELFHQYGRLMARFAPLYLNSGYTVEGEYVFLQAMNYQRILEESSWPKDRRSLLLLKGLATMLSKNGKLGSATEGTKALYDASMTLLGPGDEITTWAAARLPVVTDRKIQYAEYEQRAVIASQGEKQSPITPGPTPSERLQAMLVDKPLPLSPSWSARDTHGYTAITRAASNCDMKGILLELKRGADVNEQDANGANALQIASLNGHDAIVKLLLDHGTYVNLEGKMCGTALRAASNAGHLTVVRMLLSHGAEVNAESFHYGSALKSTALERASWNGHDVVVQLLLDSGADVNGGKHIALLEASNQGHLAVVQILLSHGAEVNAKSFYHGTALHNAASNGHHSVMQLLLKNGADVNAWSDYHGTALHQASKYGYTAVVTMLLSNGAAVNAKGEHTGTALHEACRRGHMAVAEVLLNNGADANAKGGTYGTPVELAVLYHHHHIIQLLLANGATLPRSR